MAESLLQQIRNKTGDLYEKIATVSHDIPAAWQSQLATFREKAHTFAGLYSELQGKSNVAAKNPELKKQYDALMVQGNVIQRTIMDLLTRIGAAVQSVGTVSGLAAIPLIPIAAVGAATYALTSWVNNAMVMRTQLITVEKALAAGANPDAVAASAAKIVEKQASTGNVIDQASGLIKWGLVGVGVYLAWPLLKKVFRGQ